MDIFERPCVKMKEHKYVQRVLRSCTKTVLRSPSPRSPRSPRSSLVTSQSPANNGQCKLDYMTRLNLQSTARKTRSLVRRSLSFSEPLYVPPPLTVVPCYVQPPLTVLQDLTDNAPRLNNGPNWHKTDAAAHRLTILTKTDACLKRTPVLNVVNKSYNEHLILSDSAVCSGVCVHHRIDVSSEVGQRMQSGGRAKCSASIKQCVVHTNAEQFCGLNPPQDKDPAYGFRARPETYETTYRVPRSSSSFAHVYRTTRGQREVFCKAFDAGLSVESWLLKRRMIKCTVVVRRLADVPYKRWCLPSCVVRLGQRVTVASMIVGQETSLGQTCTVVVERISDDGPTDRDCFLTNEDKRTIQELEVNSVIKETLTSKPKLVGQLTTQKLKASACTSENKRSEIRTARLNNRGIHRPRVNTRRDVRLRRKCSASVMDVLDTSVTSALLQPSRVAEAHTDDCSNERLTTRQTPVCNESTSSPDAPTRNGFNRLEQLDNGETFLSDVASRNRTLRKRAGCKEDSLGVPVKKKMSVDSCLRDREALSMGRDVLKREEYNSNKRELPMLATRVKTQFTKTVSPASQRDRARQCQTLAGGNVSDKINGGLDFTSVHAGGDGCNRNASVHVMRSAIALVKQRTKHSRASRLPATRDPTLPRLIDSWKCKRQFSKLKASSSWSRGEPFLDLPRLVPAPLSSAVLDFTPPVTPQSVDCRRSSEHPDSCCSDSVYSETSQEEDVRWERSLRSHGTRSQLVTTE